MSIALVTRQPDANVVATIDAIKATLPQLQVILPPQASLNHAVITQGNTDTGLRTQQRTLTNGHALSAATGEVGQLGHRRGTASAA